MPHRKPRNSDERRVPHVIGYDPRDHHGPGLSEDHPQRRPPLPMGVNGRRVEFSREDRERITQPDNPYDLPTDNQRMFTLAAMAERLAPTPKPRYSTRFVVGVWAATFALLSLVAYLFATSGQ